MLEEQEGMLNQLPEDVLANILRRLAPRCLATSRCVCKPWCTIIDTRHLLCSDLLPLSVIGIFINFHDLIFSECFSRSSTGPTISNYLPVRDNFSNHCNGLLLLNNYVVNPATRQWVQLPRPPSPHLGSDNFFQKGCLVFDPTLSPHYEVFLIPHVCGRCNFESPPVIEELESPAIEELEWPLSPCKLHVFSSRTKGWEERSFVREGDAVGTVADMRLDSSYRYHCHNSVYWRGALYVHCQTNFVMRISLLDGKYQVIKPPAEIELTPYPTLYLGKSQKGVYCALDDHYVYILDESYGKMDWVLKAGISLRHKQTDRPKPWTLQDINYDISPDDFQDGNDEVTMEQKIEWGFDKNNAVETKEWDSDNDDVIETKEWDSDNETKGWRNSNSGGDITFLGFHPYKEVVFLSERLRPGLAYHLNSSKVQDLGNLSPTYYHCMGIEPFIEGSFPYTPWMGEFPEEK